MKTRENSTILNIFLLILGALISGTMAFSQVQEAPPGFGDIPSSYYIYGQMYEHETGGDDAFSKFWTSRKEIENNALFPDHMAFGSSPSKVSSHLENRGAFLNFEPYVPDAGRGVNVIVVAPTYTSISQIPATPALRRSASLNTLDALQQAIDDAPNNTIIQLQEGFYDLSAVLNADLTAMVCEYNYYNGTAGTFCQKYGPYNLKSHLGSTDMPAGYGLVVLDKKKLTIAGAINSFGMPASVFLGNPLAKSSNPPTPNYYQYNVAFSIGGGSNQVTVTGIEFRDFAYPVRVLDQYSLPTPIGMMFSSDPAFAGGSFKTEIVQNVFKEPLAAVLIEGAHVLPQVRSNMIDMGYSLSLRSAVNVFGVPGQLLENPRIEGNVIFGGQGFTGINAPWGFVENGRINDNSITGGSLGVQILGSSGWTIQNNTFSGCFINGILMKSNVYTVPAPVLFDQFVQRSSQNKIIENSFQGMPGIAISIWGSTDNEVINNSITTSAVGIQLFFDMAIAFNPPPAFVDWYLIPADFNMIRSNTVSSSGIGVMLANYARNNEVIRNSVGGNFGPGYILYGPLPNIEGDITLGRASGNYIIDPDLESNPFLLADLSGCAELNGITFCQQLDYDLDGSLNEETINGLNDDGDFKFISGFPSNLIDEDPSDDPNIYLPGDSGKDMIARDGEDEPTAAGLPEMICYPNPVDQKSTVTVTLHEDTYMTLNLYNEQGQEVLNIDGQFRVAGTYQYEIVRRDLSPGMYVLRLTTHSSVLTEKVILGR